MQQRNFILFMVLSFLILIGWVWVQNKVWPRKSKNHQNEQAVQRVDWLKYGAIARATNLIGSRGLPLGMVPNEILLTQDLQFTPPERRRETRWEDLTPEHQKVAVLLPPPLPSTLGILAQLIPKLNAEPPVEEIRFGGEGFFLEGTFTTRGAGIRKLFLNKFQAANWLGEPTAGDLELIQDDTEMASFLMYHYPVGKGKDLAEVPVLTLGQRVWKLESNELLNKDNPQGPTQEIRFSTDIPDESFKHLRIVKTYRLGPRDYHLTLILEIQDERRSNDGEITSTPFRYQLAGAHGLPIEGFWYTNTFRDSVIGMVDSHGSLWRTKEEAARVSTKRGGEAVPDPDSGKSDSFLQYAGVITQFFGSIIVVDNEQPPADQGGMDYKKILRWARPTSESAETKGKLIEIDNKYAVVAETGGVVRPYILLPRVKKHLEDAKIKKDTPVVISYYELNGRRVATWIRPGQVPRGAFDDLTVRVNSEIIEFKPGQKVAHQFMLYHGPVKTKLLAQFSGNKAVDPALVDRYTYQLHLRTLTDYPSSGPLGTFSQTIRFTDLLIAVTNIMHGVLFYLHFLVGSYGLTIILLTVLVRGLMFPISRRQAYLSVKMQEIAPELKKIKEKYGTDRQAQTAATMEVYRKHKVSPLGSCLPLLLQMPIFLGLYYALQESIHFRLAEFVWIKNLAAPDMFMWWTEKIPWISEPDSLGGFLYLGPFLNLLPLAVVALMMVQQKMMTPPPVDEQQEMQQKMMKYMMIFFGIMFYKVASGLCIYYISSSLWGVAERRFLPKKKNAVSLATATGNLTAKLGTANSQGKTKSKGPGQGKKQELPDGTVQKVKDWWAEVLKQAKKK